MRISNFLPFSPAKNPEKIIKFSKRIFGAEGVTCGANVRNIFPYAIIFICLREADPIIWRRLIIPARIRVLDLEKILQVSMGWTGSYESYFCLSPSDSSKNKNNTSLSTQDKFSFNIVYDSNVFVDFNFFYVYKLEGSWIHEIKVEKLFFRKKNCGFFYVWVVIVVPLQKI